jgi:hypothetical protein
MKYSVKKLIALMALSAVCATAAHAEIVVVVGAKAGKGPMTNEQVTDIFLGRDNSMEPVDLSDSTGLRNDFYTKVTGKDAAQVKSLWTKLIFTGKATPPEIASSAADVKSKLAASGKSIGYLNKSDVDSSVKVVLTVE